jgi:hypothetical protein
MVGAHQPWLRSVDRRQATATIASVRGEKPGYSTLVSVVHPYVPAAPVRRTTVGGGLTEQQVIAALRKMRTDESTKSALLEIVYRRRSTLEVSNESGVPVETLYVYASRLRRRIENNETA